MLIRPKIDVDRVFQLLTYARNLRFDRVPVGLEPRQGLVGGFVAAYVVAVARALRAGPLQGYVLRTEAISGFRGRLRVADQARLRFGLPLPAEVSFDDFTVDIAENRLLKVALLRLSRIPIESRLLRRRLGQALAALDGVSAVKYTSKTAPKVEFNRLNRHYEQAVELSRLVLANTSVELRSGKSMLSQFLINMNDVFEDFVYEALKKRLPAGSAWIQGRKIHLDVDRRLRLEPDLSLWEGSTCRFIGDAKYKRTQAGEHHDLYQLLAYCQAVGLREGLLLYADAGESGAYLVRHGDVTLRVESVNLGAPMSDLELRLDQIAASVLSMATAVRSVA